MSRLQSTLCRSAPWRTFARRVVLPWGLQGFRPEGEVLEIGAGSGAMAAELLATHPDVRLTVTDVDQAMVEVASARLARFGDRVRAQKADATALPFPDARFDSVLSWIMLHHTLEWEKALSEALRVVRPGGRLVGYDLLSRAPLVHLHQAADAQLRLMGLGELRDAIGKLPVGQALLKPSLGGAVVRFTFRKTG